jgi:hypothetical protein
MFENSGGKIKSFASILFAIMAVGGLIGGIVAAIAARSFWLFLGVAIGSIVSAYVTSLFLYGFGDLIESSQNTAYTNKMIMDRLNHPDQDMRQTATYIPAAPPAATNGYTAPVAASYVSNNGSAQSAASQPVSAFGTKTAMKLPDGKWRCSCGRINESYVSSCACGMNKRDVFAPPPTE